jgi:hypothetical protein
LSRTFRGILRPEGTNGLSFSIRHVFVFVKMNRSGRSAIGSCWGRESLLTRAVLFSVHREKCFERNGTGTKMWALYAREDARLSLQNINNGNDSRQFNVILDSGWHAQTFKKAADL